MRHTHSIFMYKISGFQERRETAISASARPIGSTFVLRHCLGWPVDKTRPKLHTHTHKKAGGCGKQLFAGRWNFMRDCLGGCAVPVVSLFFPYPLIASLVVKQSGHCFAVSLFGVSDGATEPVSSSSSCISPEALLSIDTGSQRNIVKHVFKRVISIWGPGYLDGPVSAERRSRAYICPRIE